MSATKEENEEIERYIKAFRTFDRMLEFERNVVPSGDNAIRQAAASFLEAQNTILEATVKLIIEQLFHSEAWQSLSHKPAEFDRKLADALGTIRSAVKWRYGIRAARLRGESPVDKRIWELRETGRSFGAIAQQINRESTNPAWKKLNTGTVKQRYHRYSTHQEKLLRQYCELIVCFRRHPERCEELWKRWLETARTENLLRT